jgi:hypothetical protein
VEENVCIYIGSRSASRKTPVYRPHCLNANSKLYALTISKGLCNHTSSRLWCLSQKTKTILFHRILASLKRRTLFRVKFIRDNNIKFYEDTIYWAGNVAVFWDMTPWKFAEISRRLQFWYSWWRQYDPPETLVTFSQTPRHHDPIWRQNLRSHPPTIILTSEIPRLGTCRKRLSEGISTHQQLQKKSAATALNTVLASAHT